MREDGEWAGLAASFDVGVPGVRQIIVAAIDRAATSCGFGAPRFEYRGEREELIRSAEKKGPEGMARYRRDKNLRSIDGLVTTLGKALGAADQA